MSDKMIDRQIDKDECLSCGGNSALIRCSSRTDIIKNIIARLRHGSNRSRSID